MSFVRSLLLYTAAVVIALIAVPSAIVGWSELSPRTFGTAVHVAVDIFDDGESTNIDAAGPVATASAPAQEGEPKTVLGQQLASVQ